MKRILFINPPVVCVNECQMGWYSFAHPTSILKLIAWHRLQGNETAFIDCMDYEGGSLPGSGRKQQNEGLIQPGDDPFSPGRLTQPYKKLPLGSSRLHISIDTFILGKSIHWLEDELKKQAPLDEI